jgi:hypothetical protein
MGVKLKKLWNINSFFSHILVPLIVLTLYFVCLSWILPPESVNDTFVEKARKRSFLLATGLYLAFFVFFNLKKNKDFSLNISREKVSFADFILVLLPLTPVVQYIINNQDILSPLGSLYVLAVFASFSVFFIIVAPTLLGVVGSTKTLMILSMALAFTIINMASFSAEFAWYGRGNLRIQLAFLSAVFLVGWTIYNLIDKKLLYFLVIIYFLSSSAIQLLSMQVDKTTRTLRSTDNKLVQIIDSRNPLFTPNIYLIIYDAYVINETMLQYSIDNSAQEDYLIKSGFKLYPYTYSLGASSVVTMTLALNASSEFYGHPRRGASGDGIIHNLLKSYGYQTYGIFRSDYFFQGIGSSYDYSFPEQSDSPDSLKSANILVKAIFMGEFRFDVEFDRAPLEQFIKHKLSLFRNVSNKPRFIYMHTGPGHSQNSGACLPNETELFKERLIKANEEMKRDIDALIQNDPGAIIIVAGDHGPYLTKNCTSTELDYDISEITRLDVQDRFGTFLAIKWPTEGFAKYDDITVLQDLFPAIFAYLFKDDKLLEAKVDPETIDNKVISGASVKNGIIHGGINDGEPLFLGAR